MTEPNWTDLTSHRAPPTRRAMVRAATTSNRSPEVTRSGLSRTKGVRTFFWKTPSEVWKSGVSLSSNHTQTNATDLLTDSVQETLMSRRGGCFYSSGNFWREQCSNIVAEFVLNHSQNVYDWGQVGAQRRAWVTRLGIPSHNTLGCRSIIILPTGNQTGDIRVD